MKRLITFILMLLPVIANAYTGKVVIDGIYYNLITKANVAEVTYGDSPYSIDVITIPSTIEYEGATCNVTSIGEKAFQNSNILKSITIPGSVTSIGNAAFSGCKGLTEIIIPENVVTIEDYAFYGCTGLTKISFPSTLSKMYNVFDNCPNLESVNITDLASWCKLNFWQRKCNPLNYASHLYVNGEDLTELVVPEEVTNVGNSFWGFKNLKSLTISEGAKEISACAFGNCDNLVSISLANTITKIDYYAFRSCKALKKVLIPNSVKYIGEEVFKGCTNLEEIVIGRGLNYLGPASFSNCTELKDVYVYTDNRPDTYYDNAFSNSYINYATLHVKESLVPSFKSDIPWKNFGAVVKVPELIYNVDGVVYTKDIVMIGTPITPITEPEKEGHTFSGWSEIPVIMPNEDVTITGSFSVNSYTLTYIVDGEVYKTEDVKYGSTITPEEEPTKTGYTFSGWSEIPSTMPANDITINGTFIINSYILSYYVDGVEYKTIEQEYNSSVTPEEDPIKEGYSFSGWSEIPETMPAHDLIINGSFIVNKYKVTYIIDGEFLKTDYVEYGATIVPPDVENKEGYTFTGWTDVPETMPAHDITIYGSFTSGIEEIKKSDMSGQQIYTINGKRISKFQRGINILRCSDGKVRKVRIK